jgi:hypothetical protein
MSLALVKQALETRLAAQVGALATQWENTAFTPVPGTPYQRVNFIPAEPANPTLASNHWREQGEMQVTLFYPINAGSGAALQAAEGIRAWFPRASTFTAGGVTVTVPTTPAIGPGFYDADRYVLPVRVRYRADINV